jgi:hypothetical protein
MGTVFYTAIINDYDELKPAPAGFDRCVCFADGDYAAHPNRAGWEFRRPAYRHADPTLIARWCKILAHQHFPWASATLWADANVHIASVPAWVDLAAYPHPERSCVYAEALAVLEARLDSRARIMAVVEYLLTRCPLRAGLHQTNILVRRPVPAVAALEHAWWRLVEGFCRRDQLTFDYVARLLEVPIEGVAWADPGFTPYVVAHL